MSQPPSVGPSTGATTTPKRKYRQRHAALVGRKALQQNGLR